MANPSTTNATAIGKEVIRRTYTNSSGNSEFTLLSGVANHIITVISIIMCSQTTSEMDIDLYIDADLAGTDIKLLNTFRLNGKQTFVWNDKFALTETDKLHGDSTDAGGVDWWITYIDQQFAA